MGTQEFPRRFAAAGRPGAYLRILAEGEVGAGDPVEVVHRPAHGLTVAEVSRIYHDDHAGAARLLGAPELAGTWKRWAERFVADASRARG
jgi:MOSC domain-containing protein YiiM